MTRNEIRITSFIAATVITVTSAAYFGTGNVSAAFFSDVKQSDWFWNDVSALSEDGIIVGYPDGSFRPQSFVSNAEFIKLLCVTLRLKPQSGTSFRNTADSSLWYAEYLRAATEAGVLRGGEFRGGDFRPNDAILREDVAKYICRALNIEPMPYASPFHDTDSVYATALYSEMLMEGSIWGDVRYFKPQNGITRAECSAVINRLSQYRDNRTAYINERSESENFSAPVITNSPRTVSDFSLYLMYMVKNGIGEAKLTYTDRPFGSEALAEIKRAYLEAFTDVYNRHPEYFSLMSTEVSTSGNSGIGHLNIRLGVIQESGIGADELSRLRVQAFGKAKSIAGNIISPEMSTIEKASAIHDYIVSCTSYVGDRQSKNGYTPYLAYGALVEGIAVCQGYASAFNALCAEAGIRSCAVTNGSHMWNIVLADGKFYVFDTTWDDPVPDIPGKVENTYRGVPLEKASADGVHLSKYFDINSIF